MSIASYLARRSLHYGWLVAGLTFLALLVAAGIRATPSVLIVPLEHEFGWSRATISLAISINLVLYGLIGPFAEAVISKRLSYLVFSAYLQQCLYFVLVNVQTQEILSFLQPNFILKEESSECQQ